MTVFENIRNLREDKDMTQKQMADLLYINRRTYSSYETGVHSIPVEILIQISKIHGVSVDYLLGLTKNIKPYGE